MTQQATTTIQQAANGGQVATQRKPVDILKSMMNAESVQEQFKNALGKNSATFVASVIDLYNGDSNLQLCNPKQVVMEALKAATWAIRVIFSLPCARDNTVPSMRMWCMMVSCAR